MAKFFNAGARKLPTILGGGILGIAFVGLCYATMGATIPLGAELLSAAGGMLVAGRYA